MLAVIIGIVIGLVVVVFIAGHVNDGLRKKLEKEQIKVTQIDSQLSRMIESLNPSSEQDQKLAHKLECYINVFTWSGYPGSQIREALIKHETVRKQYLSIVKTVKKEIENEKEKTTSQKQVDSDT